MEGVAEPRILGFTGSAGTVVVTESRAALWTDGRYWLQAANQLDENWELVKDRLPDSPTFGQWLNQHSPVNSVVGADPTTMSNTVWETLSADLESEGRRLIPVERNLVDLVWEGRPKASSNPICVLHNQYTGKDWRQKVMNIRVKMTEKKADFLVVTALDEIAWMLNMRGELLHCTVSTIGNAKSSSFFLYVLVVWCAVCKCTARI